MLVGGNSSCLSLLVLAERVLIFPFDVSPEERSFMMRDDGARLGFELIITFDSLRGLLDVPIALFFY